VLLPARLLKRLALVTFPALSFPSAFLCQLSKDHLRSLGLSEKGQAARVRCIF
jgi:hypothetical protein